MEKGIIQSLKMSENTYKPSENVSSTFLFEVPPNIKDAGKNKQISVLKTIKSTSFEPHTPKASIQLSLELKKVIHERNMLTSKTRKRVFEALDEIKTKAEEETRTFKREKALLEIVNSEMKYMKHLETIINFFMKPIEQKRTLKSDDYQVLFGNINTIYSINKELVEELDKGFHNVSNAFYKIAPFLKLYSVYAYEFRNSLRILQNARSLNPVFAKFVENQESRPEVQSKLSALLITPIQRVPRYKLLLTQLYDLTSPGEKDFDALKECLSKIEDAAMHINKIVEEQENAQRLLELQRCLRSGEPNIITPGRKLKKEGILNKMSTKNEHSEKLYVVLMSDIIIFNKMKKEEPQINSLKILYIFPLNKTKVLEVLDKGCLKVICQEEELILYHEQLCETVKWIGSIKVAIECYLEDRKTLRKESSNRRPVKRKDINEYHEIGLSPGQPLKKRKFMDSQNISEATQWNGRITARRSIHSTPIKLECNPETKVHISKGFPCLETRALLNGTNLEIEISKSEEVRRNKIQSTELHLHKRRDIIVFGRKHDEQNLSKFGSFFSGVRATFKGLFNLNK